MTLEVKLEMIDGLLAHLCSGSGSGPEEEEALVLRELLADLRDPGPARASIVESDSERAMRLGFREDARSRLGVPVEGPGVAPPVAVAVAEPKESSYMRRVREEAQETRKRLGRPEPTAQVPYTNVLTEDDKDLITCMQWCRGVLAASSVDSDSDDL